MSPKVQEKAPATVGKFTPTPEQIAKWKQKFGDIFVYEADDLACYLRRPDRKVIELATAESSGGQQAFRFTEVVLANCWLDGNEELRSQDKYFMGLSGKIGEMVEIRAGELKKL